MSVVNIFAVSWKNNDVSLAAVEKQDVVVRCKVKRHLIRWLNEPKTRGENKQVRADAATSQQLARVNRRGRVCIYHKQDFPKKMCTDSYRKILTHLWPKEGCGGVFICRESYLSPT